MMSGGPMSRMSDLSSENPYYQIEKLKEKDDEFLRLESDEMLTIDRIPEDTNGVLFTEDEDQTQPTEQVLGKFSCATYSKMLIQGKLTVSNRTLSFVN